MIITLRFKLFTVKSFRNYLFLIFYILIQSCSNDVSKLSSIDIGDGNFLFPGNKNDDGCTEFHLMNESGLPTIQIIYYVDKNGDYSGSYDKDNCI